MTGLDVKPAFCYNHLGWTRPFVPLPVRWTGTGLP